ncbi:MAG: alanine--tRNA ligase [Candidatus Dadabacteria bacterium]|nr:MAG: alanine--tRNA ligase [Candidatus Dadabacteria bacterium]
MRGSEVRRSFLDFFARKGHLIVPSSSLVPVGDPTLMFTNAGMVQFKDVFLGVAEPPHPRVANSQKCLRISGKHNDLEEVGRDTYHHTFFEMLGNWSFGDYYKAEAIEWAWELLTKEWGLPAARLYATVFRTDDEAAGLWRKITGLPAERILRFDEKDNFWEMGETGPCGPCSEIHIDRGERACDRRDDPKHRCGVNAGCARFIEIWNLVFIQYTRDESGALHNLPDRHVDTGMGLERIAAVLEGVEGNYDGSLLRSIIAAAEQLSGRRYGRDPEADVSFRVVADHARAVAFMIADGIEPSNEGRGYVLRRILRRAARHGKVFGFDQPFLYRVCGAVIETMGDAYPELRERAERIAEVVRGEEERFQVTLDRGLVHLREALERLGPDEKVLPGEVAFRLYDTYGFPLDMTEDILRSRGIRVDREGFEAALAEQRERAREAQAGKGAGDFTLLVATARERGGSRFAGSFVDSWESRVIALARGGQPVDRAGEGEVLDLVVEETPFYGESGGQVGDSGEIVSAAGANLRVFDTQKPAPDVIVHRARVVRGEIAVGDEVTLRIDSPRRQAIRLNHSSTHLLHAALRANLGTGVQQAGSLVDDAHLRFDFTHPRALSDAELERIEDEVNEVVRANLPVTTEEMPYQQAIAAGALAFFGDKYGDVVRVVRMGDYSVELCGGTHVRQTGDIGLVRLVSESSVAAGVRRIEAVSGAGALERVRRRDELLREISRLLRTSEEQSLERIERLLAAVRELEKRIEALEQKQSGSLVERLVAGGKQFDGYRAVIARVDGVEAKAMRALCDQVRERIGSGVVVLAAEVPSGVALTVAVTSDLTERFHAGRIIQELAPLVAGRGGGKPELAQAGGKNPAGIPAVLEKANELLG